jgi:hypothetical protein
MTIYYFSSHEQAAGATVQPGVTAGVIKSAGQQRTHQQCCLKRVAFYSNVAWVMPQSSPRHKRMQQIIKTHPHLLTSKIWPGYTAREKPGCPATKQLAASTENWTQEYDTSLIQHPLYCIPTALAAAVSATHVVSTGTGLQYNPKPPVTANHVCNRTDCAVHKAHDFCRYHAITAQSRQTVHVIPTLARSQTAALSRNCSADCRATSMPPGKAAILALHHACGACTCCPSPQPAALVQGLQHMHVEAE